MFPDYKSFACISCLPAQKEQLRSRIELELIRLLDWSDVMGIAQQDSTLSLDFRVYQPTILNILVQQQSVLSRLCVDTFSFTDGLKSSSNQATGARLKYFPSRSHTLLEKVLSQSIEEGLHPLTRHYICSSFEVAKFEASLRKLIRLNDSLRDQMDDTLRDILLQREGQTCLALLELCSKTRDLVDLERALSIDTKGGHQASEDADLSVISDSSNNAALIHSIRFKAYQGRVHQCR